MKTLTPAAPCCRLLACALAALGLVAANPANATYTYADARASISGTDDDFHSGTGDAGGAQASASLVSSFGLVNVHGEAAANVGALHVSSFSSASVGTLAQAAPHAEFSDTFAMLAAGHAQGERGTFSLAVSVGGGLAAEINNSGYADTYVVASFYVSNGLGQGNAGAQSESRLSVGYDTGTTRTGLENFSLYITDLPFEFGRDIGVTMQLATVSDTKTYGVSFALAAADYSHTMTWSGISDVRDSAGKLVTDFSAISADSGFNFANATPVPEPGSAGLFALGLVGVGGWMRRKAPTR